ncbi:hypothetical protein CO058_03000 [candidate division WWE3 bacterium CG_4_9_14_0_2_um_filter_35_11]|uniref:PilN domain-containing protein n=1 Tax=candidate division WWE3 bacterium CG_4_9_14_0_2_um_filter_35_11 TaxID=1975077 RepID=A0A2M8ELF9_UNCKA|nr:MAG: hypothetical protein COV25_01930 [candidate division WWE3 bacterium CG10_big_fil_rev_8_21_14_0_10_35_32]PJC23550.1 MAG: hypothetical protein CO058_03000 [candidate division WWE3 bacterium CG_4_9_14_0_2_um_filter_35_11]
MPEAIDPINFIPEELLNKEETKSGPLAIVFDWTIASGRKILVVVATIVITIFFIRIKIDNDISKSIEKISEQEAKILSMSQIEKEHIQIQKKLVLIKSVKLNEINWAERFNKFSGSLPRDITIENITYTKSEVTFSAIANSSDSFSIFLTGLISDKQVKDVLLTASKYIPEDKSYSFSMEVTLNE